MIVQGIRRYIGLMFTRKSKAETLEFIFDKPTLQSIHSWFVFFDFEAQWYDEKGELIEERIVKPFQSNIKPSREFVRLVEIPIK